MYPQQEMKLFRVVFLAAILLLAERLQAQSPGTLDTNYVTLANTDVLPQAVIALADGRIYAGGNFTNYGGVGRSGLVRLNASGTLDTSFSLPAPLKTIAGVTHPDGVLALVVRADGRIVIIGAFTHLGAQKLPVDQIALINPDGTVADFAPELYKGAPGVLLNGPGNTVYIGVSRNVVDADKPIFQRLNADGSNDASFAAPSVASLHQDFNVGVVRALLHGPGDTIYAVIGSLNLEVIRLTSTGALDATFADGGRATLGTAGQQLYSTTLSGQLLLSGLGHSYRGQTLPYSLTRITLGGAIDASFVPPAGLTVSGAAVVQTDNKLLVVIVSVTGGTSVLTRLNENGSRDSSYVDPGKVPVNQLAFVTGRLVVAPDGSAFVSAFGFNAQFQQVVGIYHIFGDALSSKLGFSPIPGGGFQLAWPVGYKLQHTPTLLPPNWQDTGAISPVTEPTPDKTGYFRLVSI